jgi:spoIIIJ-associated protein
MKKVIATGKTVEESVRSALVKLGVPRSEAEIRVISEPVKGFLGLIGGKDAEVEVSVPQSPSDEAKDFVSEVLAKMGIDARVTVERNLEEEGGYVLSIDCEEDVLPIVIGRHGSTLDAIQYLTNVVANRDHEGFVKFSVDAGQYRARRRENIRRIADQAVERALKLGRPVSLESMSPAERKWIHTYLQDRNDVTTMSEGQDPYRKIKIAPKRNSYVD